MQIHVLGPGCARCNKLEANAREAAAALGIEYELTKVTDLDEMHGFGVMTTPALVVDGKVKLLGKAASVKVVKAILEASVAGQ